MMHVAATNASDNDVVVAATGDDKVNLDADELQMPSRQQVRQPPEFGNKE